MAGSNFELELYGYGTVEPALGCALYASDMTQGALRARLKRLQALGIPAPKAEDEKARRKYSLAEAHMWLVALLLEDLGAAPEFVARAVKRVWSRNLAPNAKRATADATKGDVAFDKDGILVRGNPIILDVRLSAIAGPWRTGDPDATVALMRLTPRYSDKTLRELRKRWPQLKKNGWTVADLLRESDEVGRGFDGLPEEDGWMIVRNYSEKARRLESKLQENI